MDAIAKDSTSLSGASSARNGASPRAPRGAHAQGKSLELGIAALMLSGLFVVMRHRPDFLAPVRTLGQVALFYYLLHFHVMTLFALLTGMHLKYGVASAYLATASILLVLAPACAWYRKYKADNPGGVASVRVTRDPLYRQCSRSALFTSNSASTSQGSVSVESRGLAVR